MRFRFGSNSIRRGRSRGGRRGKSSKSPKWFMFFFGLFFATIGGVVFYFIFVGPMLNVQAAKNWKQVQATVTHSEVDRHRDSDGDTTYSIDIKYQYEVDGRRHTGERYHFITGSSSGRSGKQDVVDDHPVGKQITIHVDPNDHTNAVINREMTGDFWFGLIPLIFVVVGLGIMIGGLFIKTNRGKNAKWQPQARLSDDDDPTDGVATLKPDSTPLGTFIFLCIFGLIWNGIVWGIMIFAIIPDMSHDWFMSIPLIFISVFALIGIVIIGIAIYQFLALFNPKPILEVSNGSPALGETIDLHWNLEGRSERVRELTIKLEGVESARYQRGTDTVTDTHTFHEEALYTTDDPNLILLGGQCEVTIPSDLMHSFEASNNKIIWRLTVHGDIKRWPDVNQKFNFVVRPLRLEGAYGGRY